MRKRIAALTAIACLSTAYATVSVLASSGAQATATPAAPAVAPSGSQIPSGEYDADKAHSYITFSYLHQGYSRPILGFDNFGVRLTLDADNPAKSKIFTNINAASIDSGTELFNGHLKSDRWFDVEKYPEIRFVSTQFEPTANASLWKLHGNLTIKGITRPIVLDAKVNRTGNGWWTNQPMVGVSASATLKRSEFGLGEYVPQISDDVKVNIELEFIKLDS